MSVIMSILFKDQRGNQMLVTPQPDEPPRWSNTAPTVDTLVPAPDGLTCEAVQLTSGADTVSVSATVKAKTFLASTPLVPLSPNLQLQDSSILQLQDSSNLTLT